MAQKKNWKFRPGSKPRRFRPEVFDRQNTKEKYKEKMQRRLKLTLEPPKPPEKEEKM
jgi:hypothetical protein